MAQFLGLGNGSDGVATLSGTDAPIDSTCTGTAGTRTLTVGSGLSFAAGQMVKVHQTRGSGAGTWELGQVDSYSGTTLTLKFNLVNSYSDSGANQAQVYVVKQYSQVTISGTLTAKAWDGNVGGLLEFVCNGVTNITGSVTASQKGFRGGLGNNNSNALGDSGEGTAGASVLNSSSANGNGGGGGKSGGGGPFPSGGGNGAAGTGSNPGAQVGSADLTTMNLGGGSGGRGMDNPNGVNGVIGGGIISIFSNSFLLSGSIVSNGGDGLINSAGAAGGSIFIKAVSATLGTNLITALGGTGGSEGGGNGNGGVGRIRIEVCSRTGSTNPAASEAVGGQPFCGSAAQII